MPRAVWSRRCCRYGKHRDPAGQPAALPAVREVPMSRMRRERKIFHRTRPGWEGRVVRATKYLLKRGRLRWNLKWTVDQVFVHGEKIG